MEFLEVFCMQNMASWWSQILPPKIYDSILYETFTLVETNHAILV